MKPYMDEYQSISENVVPRLTMLEQEFATMILGRVNWIYWWLDLETMAKKTHTDELSKLVQNLTNTRSNLSQIGTILKAVEERIDVIEKKIGLDDDDL